MAEQLTKRNTLEQGRAAHAYQSAKDTQTKEYRSAVKKLPMYIKTNGLGAALAFYNGKKDHHKKIYDRLSDWLCSETSVVKDFVTKGDLVEQLVSLDSQKYRAITVEVMAYLNWLRRFADGFKKPEETE